MEFRPIDPCDLTINDLTDPESRLAEVALFRFQRQMLADLQAHVLGRLGVPPAMMRRQSTGEG